MTLLHLVVLLCIAAVAALPADSPTEPNSRMCMIYCQYGFRQNANGQQLCECKKSPCDNDEAPLADYFCGRGPNRRECPATHQCAVAPNDAYAVCCPRAQNPSARSSSKLGQCPPPSGMMGLCITRCTDDDDCPDTEKCCGGCPRQCTKPVFA